MKIKPLVLSALAAASLVLGTAATASASTVTAKQVAARLVPLGCHAAPSDGSSTIGIAPRVELYCSLNGEDVYVDQYRSQQQVTYNAGLMRSAGCSMLKAFGVSTAWWVQAGNVTVSAQTGPTTREIKRAIGRGAALETVRC